MRVGEGNRRGAGKILEAIYKMTGTMSHNIQLTREKRGLVIPAYWTQSIVAKRRKRREGWLQHCPFRTTRRTACTHLLSNVMWFTRFLSHLILTLSWWQKNKIRSWIEKFAPSYNPFFRVVKITILATARIARNTTRCSPWNWGTFWRDPKTDKVARSSRKRAQLFLLSHNHSEDYQACLSSPLCNSSRTCSVQAVSWARTLSCSRSSNLVPNSNASEPPPSYSRVDPREDPRRIPPLDPDTVPFETENGHWIQEGCKWPYGIWEHPMCRNYRQKCRHGTCGFKELLEHLLL